MEYREPELFKLFTSKIEILYSFTHKLPLSTTNNRSFRDKLISNQPHNPYLIISHDICKYDV